MSKNIACRKGGVRSLEKKHILKHAVFSIDIIDKLIAVEQNPKKIELLRQLRKEAKKVWQP